MQKMTNPQFLQPRFKNKVALFYFKIQNSLHLPFLYILPFITRMYFTGQIKVDTRDPAWSEDWVSKSTDFVVLFL